MPQSQGISFAAEPLTLVVRHQLWDGNVEEHVDQGVSIDVTATLYGKETSLLRFNCFDNEKSYTYGPENPELSTPGRVGGGHGVACQIDPITEANPIACPIHPLGHKPPQMLERAGYRACAALTDMENVRAVLP